MRIALPLGERLRFRQVMIPLLGMIDSKHGSEVIYAARTVCVIWQYGVAQYSQKSDGTCANC